MNKRSPFRLALLCAVATLSACGGPGPESGQPSPETVQIGPGPGGAALAALSLSGSALPIAGVTAISSDGNVPANVLDGSVSTRWSCSGVGCWIRADLGAQVSVTGLAVGWYLGDTRVNAFTISASNDDSTYTQIYSGKSTGTTAQPEGYALPATRARYVKLTINGNTVNSWASVSELLVYGTGATQGGSAVPVAGVTALSSDGNVPSNVLDRNLSTRWSCYGSGCWIRADLGAQVSVTGLVVAWYMGDTRANTFTISTSNDDSTYTQVYSGKSSGSTAQLESYAFPATQARYVKLTVNGNTVNSWASVSELQVNGGSATPPSTPPPACTRTVSTSDDINSAVNALTAGQTLCLRGGTYTQAIGVNPGLKGTPTAPITVQASPGETVILKPGGGRQFVIGINPGRGATAAYDTNPASNCYTGRCATTVPQWITFRNLVLDGTGLSVNNSYVVFLMGTGVSACTNRDGDVGPHHITFDKVEVRNGPDQGIMVGAGDYTSFINCNVHDNGFLNTSHGTHGLYIEAKHLTFTGGSIWHNRNEGVHAWTGSDCGDTSDITIQNATINSNNFWGVGFSCGARNKILNSKIYSQTGADGGPGAGISAHNGAWGTIISGNTICTNAGPAVQVGDDVWWNGQGCAGNYEPLDPDLHGASRGVAVSNTTVTNNVVYGNASGNDSTGQIVVGSHAQNTSLSGNTTAH